MTGDVTVRADDLMHCMQVAVWRAGMLRPEVAERLLAALRVADVPKPGLSR